MIQLFEVKKGLKFQEHTLRNLLPDVQVALFFGKLYELNARELGGLLALLFKTDVLKALTAEGHEHSQELQDYVVELGYQQEVENGAISFDDTPPPAEFLPELWKAAQVEVALALKDVAEKLKTMITKLPGKQGRMVFESMMVMNTKRPVLGDYKARVSHYHQTPNLVVLDVSGSMTPATVTTLIDDVVALAYEANASLAIVSDNAYYWEPGQYNTDVVLDCAEYSGTHYEMLAPLFDNKAWGTVITIADFDSSWSAKDVFARVNGTIELLLDISLVPVPTFLSEVVGTLAKEVRPLMVASSYHSVIN